jgi:hypothetical protein
VSLFFVQFSHLADKKKVSAKNAKPQPRLFWGKKWPKVTGTLFYYERFLQFAIFRQ